MIATKARRILSISQKIGSSLLPDRKISRVGPAAWRAGRPQARRPFLAWLIAHGAANRANFLLGTASGGGAAVDDVFGAGHERGLLFPGGSPGAPFGGYKQSAFGREGGRAGI